MPDTGRAAVVAEYNEPLVIEELPVPDPEPGALVVRIEATTVCGSDVHAWQGAYDGVLPIEKPVILGHEIVGSVVKIGAGAEVDSVGQPVRLGDRVVWAHESCGRCRYCTVLGRPTLCPNRRVGLLQSCRRFPHFTGGFAEYGYVWPKSGRLRVPSDVKSAWAAASSCALRTVVNAVERLGTIDYRHSVLVQGSGPLGLFATAILATHSPKQIVVVGAPDDRLEIARAWGADATVSIDAAPTEEERIEAVRSLTGDGPDVLLEASGGRTALGEGIQMAAPDARYGIVGSVGGPPQPVLAHLITNRGLTLFGSYGGVIDSYFKALVFMSEHRERFDWDLMLGRSYGLDEVTAALERQRSLEEVKPIVVPVGPQEG